MKLQKTIYVTEKDLKEGKPTIAECCPVALALKRYFKEENVGVGCRTFQVGKKTFKLSKVMQKRIVEIDSFYDVKPFKFKVTWGGKNARR